MGLLEQGAAPAVAPTAPELAQSAAAAGAPGPQQAPAAAPAQAPAKAASAPDIGEEEATPEEQQAYERAMQGLSKVLYANEKSSTAIVDQVDPNNKVDSTAKVSMLFLKQLDEKMDLDEGIVAEVTQEAVSRIIELAEARHGISYEENEMQAVLGATWEGVSQMFGMDEAGHQELMASVGEDKMPALQQQYEGALNG